MYYLCPLLSLSFEIQTIIVPDYNRAKFNTNHDPTTTTSPQVSIPSVVGGGRAWQQQGCQAQQGPAGEGLEASQLGVCPQTD